MNAMGEQNNLMFNGTSMSYRIGEYNKILFIPGNTAAVQTTNFQGFKLNNNYRVYIDYYNAENVYLNQANSEEMSLSASPMIQASVPQVQCKSPACTDMFLHHTECFISAECQNVCDSEFHVHTL